MPHTAPGPRLGTGHWTCEYRIVLLCTAPSTVSFIIKPRLTPDINLPHTLLGFLPPSKIASPEPVQTLVWPAAYASGEEDYVLATLASGAVLCASVPSQLAAGGGRPSRQADMHLGNHEGVTVRSVKVEVPLISAAGLPAGGHFGDLVGLGSDKLLYAVPLPSDLSAWTGAKGRAVRSSARLPAHSAAAGALVPCRSGLLIATASSDGHIATHAVVVGGGGGGGSSLTTVSLTALPLHDVSAGGAAAVAFDLSGRWLVSAGRGGDLFLFESPGAHVRSAAAVPPAITLMQAAPVDHDAFDEPSELTEAQVQGKRMTETAAMAAASQAHHRGSAAAAAAATHSGGAIGAR